MVVVHSSIHDITAVLTLTKQSKAGFVVFWFSNNLVEVVWDKEVSKLKSRHQAF
jgi:hypothetical protein